MNVVYDISVLGLGHRIEMARTGVFRVVENVARALVGSREVNLTFCSTIAPSAATDYLRETPAFQAVGFRPGAARVVTDRALSRLGSLSINSMVGRAARGLARRSLGFGLSLLPEVSERELSAADVFHSPHFALPRLSGGHPRVKRLLTVYDLIPILHPEWFPSGGPNLAKLAIDSLTPDDWAVCISECTRRDLLEYRPDLDPGRVRVTHLAADSSFRPDPRESQWEALKRTYGLPDEPYALSLSTLEPRKNIAHVIRQYSRLVSEGQIGDMRLVLVGTRGWKMEEMLTELDRSAEIRQRIVVTGFVPDRDLAPIYSHALMFLYPSFYEGFGLPPLEAMQCGVPVITSNTSSLPEVVGDSGILVAPTDSDALCQAILTLHRDEALRRQLSARAIERATLFSWSRCADQVMVQYRSAAKA